MATPTSHSDAFSRKTPPTSFKRDVRFESWMDRRTYWQESHEFLQVAGTTLPAYLAVHDTSSAGSPTKDYVANQGGGVYRLKHDSQSEQQNLALYGGDHLTLDPSKDPFFIARVKLNTAGAAFTADQRLVIGMAAARNATLDSNATHAWFRIEGANFNILTESDDATTDDDDNDTTLDWSDNAWAWFRCWIDYTRLKAYFEVDLGTSAGWVAAGPPLAIAAITSSHLMQPYIEIQRDAGAEEEDLLIDSISFGAKR